MSPFETFHAERRAAFLAHVRPHIQERRAKGTPLTPEEYDALDRMNSYERHHLFPLFDDALLVREAKYYHSQSRAGGATFYEWGLSGHCYDEVLARDYVPALLARLEKVMQERDQALSERGAAETRSADLQGDYVAALAQNRALAAERDHLQTILSRMVEVRVK